MGSVGSPLEFIAETNLDSIRSSLFKWNFGDGSEGNGEIVTHTYEYPGEYVLVLNLASPSGQATSRINVKIIDPALVITATAPERIELKNNSKYETNLFGRALVSGQKVFPFPRDTIIGPGQSISFGSKVTGLSPGGLYDVSLISIGENRQELQISAKIEEQKVQQISSVYNQLGELEQQLANISDRQRLSIIPVTAQEIALPETDEPKVAPEEKSAIQTATVAKSGWFETIKRFFLRTR